MSFDNHVMIDGRVSDIRFKRLGKEGISHTAVGMVIPADGERPPVNAHAVFFGRTAEAAYEMLEEGSHLFVSGWLQSRRLPNGLAVLNVVGERFRLLESAGGTNQVVLLGRVNGPPYFAYPNGKPYLRLQLVVGRSTHPPRGDDSTDLIRVVLRAGQAAQVAPRLSPGSTLWLRGHLHSRWRQGRLKREVRGEQVTLLPVDEGERG